MTKFFLALLIMLTLTACHERTGAKPATSSNQYMSSSQNDDIDNQAPMAEKGLTENRNKDKVENENIIKEIPILEDTQPISATPVVLPSETQIFKGGERSDGLDIKAIRSSYTSSQTRLVFDIYKSNTKATQAGKYTFTYHPKQKQITAIVNGYRKFSALPFNKTRTFASSSMVKDIKREKYMDDSGLKFSINLRKPASVNVFELKSPARIVVDIIPN